MMVNKKKIAKRKETKKKKKIIYVQSNLSVKRNMETDRQTRQIDR